MPIPETAPALDFILDRVEQGSNILDQIEDLKGELGAFAEEVSDTYDMTKGDYTKLVKAYNDETKVRSNLDNLNKTLVDVEKLKKLKN
jgi:uncharacterized coiled-coil DUF342 family protein